MTKMATESGCGSPESMRNPRLPENSKIGTDTSLSQCSLTQCNNILKLCLHHVMKSMSSKFYMIDYKKYLREIRYLVKKVLQFP